MANRTINLYAKDNLGPVVEGVLLRILTTAGAFVTEGVTDVNGKAGPFVLDDVNDYHVAASKPGTIFPLPYVLQFSADQDFDIFGEVVDLPVATQPNMCRISGVLKSSAGIPLSGATIHVVLDQDRVIVDSEIVGGMQRITANRHGYFDFQLYRGFSYLVTLPILVYGELFIGSSDQLEGEGFMPLCLNVPDQASLGIAAFIHPRPARVQFDDTGVSVAVDDTDSTKNVSVLQSNGVLASGALLDFLEYSSSDENVATVNVTEDGTLTVSGIAAGTATVQAARKADVPPVVVPDDALVVDTFTITVT